jgi:hypothetical protein
MKHFHAAALAVLMAAPAWAQQPSARPEIITLTGPDGTAHACKVLRTYKHPSGGTACEVRDETNGEILTVIEAAGPEAAKTEAKTVGVKESVEPSDPILKLKDYAGAKAQVQLAPPASPYNRPPVSLAQRMLAWLRHEPALKPVPVQMAQPKLPTSEMLAAYHPDPVIRLIGCMSDDLLPSMREISAETLARTAMDRPDVVEAMIRTVQMDPAPSVRICCCRCLVQMQVRSPECVSALKSLEDDREESIRTAAAAALTLLER